MKLPTREITFRDIKNADKEKLIQDMQLDKVEDEDLDSFLDSFEKNFTNSLDLNAQVRTVKIAERQQKLWYNNTLRTQPRKVRNRERIWRKYKLEHQWLAYKCELTIYNKLLYKHKVNTYGKKFVISKETRNIYMLLSLILLESKSLTPYQSVNLTLN